MPGNIENIHPHPLIYPTFNLGVLADFDFYSSVHAAAVTRLISVMSTCSFARLPQVPFSVCLSNIVFMSLFLLVGNVYKLGRIQHAVNNFVHSQWRMSYDKLGEHPKLLT